jgi:hypothetical protein
MSSTVPNDGHSQRGDAATSNNSRRPAGLGCAVEEAAMRKLNYRKLGFVVAVIVLIASFPRGAPATANFSAKVWNVARDFRIAPNEANPSPDSFGNKGVWSYLQVHAHSNIYTLLPDFTTDKANISGLESWWGTTVLSKGETPGRGQERYRDNRKIH